MGVSLSEFLLEGKAKESDAENLSLRIGRHMAIGGSSGGGTTAVVRGGSPLQLPNAQANSLNYVKAYGGAYLGVPPEYTVMEFVENASSTFARLNTSFTMDDVELFIEFTAVNGTCPLIQSRQTSGETPKGLSGSGNNIFVNFGTQLTSNIMRSSGHRYQILATYNNNQQTLYVKDLTNGQEDTTSINTGFTVSSGIICLFGDTFGARMPAGARVYSAYIRMGGTLQLNLVPVMHLGQFGLYDTVNDRFIQAQTGQFIGSSIDEPTPHMNAYMPICTNNGYLQADGMGNIYTAGAQETILDSLNNTALCEMLLSWDDRQDVQEILSGQYDKMVGVRVFTGNESWSYDSSYQRMYTTVPNLYSSSITRTIGGMCSHFRWLHNQEVMSKIKESECYSAGGHRMYFHTPFTNVPDWRNWLSQQMAEQTPLFIVFPLENPVSSSVAPQTLQVAGGNNTLTITQASLSGLELEAQYTKV